MGSRLMVSKAHKSAGTHTPISAGGGVGLRGRIARVTGRTAALPDRGVRQLSGNSIEFFTGDRFMAC